MRQFDFPEIVIIQFNENNKQIIKDQLSLQKIEYEQNDNLRTIRIQFDRKEYIRLSQLILLQERQRIIIPYQTKIHIMIAILNEFLKLDAQELIVDDIDLFDIWIQFTQRSQEKKILAYIIKFAQNEQIMPIYGRLRGKLTEIINKLFLQTEKNTQIQQILDNINQGSLFLTLFSNFKIISTMYSRNFDEIIFKIKNQEKIKAFYEQLSNYYDNRLDNASTLQFKQLIINKIIEDTNKNTQNILSSTNQQFNEILRINQVTLNQHQDSLKVITFKSYDEFFTLAQTSRTQEELDLSGLERCSISTIRIIEKAMKNEKTKLQEVDQRIENVLNQHLHQDRFTQNYIVQMRNLFEQNQQVMGIKKEMQKKINRDPNQNIDFDNFEMEIKNLLIQLIRQQIETLIQSLQ